MMRIVFFNISYMNFYKGKEDDTMVGNFRYVREKGDEDDYNWDYRDYCYWRDRHQHRLRNECW